MASPSHDLNEIVPEVELRQEPPVVVAAANRNEMTKSELLKTPDLTSPNSILEWDRIWGKGADVTEHVVNEKSCKQRCFFKFHAIGPGNALKECYAGCEFFTKLQVMKGTKCISGSAKCNGLLEAANTKCKAVCKNTLKTEPWVISAPLTPAKADQKVVKKMLKKKKAKAKGKKKATKKKAKKTAKKKKAEAKGKKPKNKGQKKLQKAALKTAEELDKNVNVAKFANHFCSQGCDLAAANVCYQGSGECLNTPEFQTKWPKVGSCTKKTNRCLADATPTCRATKCIHTKEQCHGACHTWHGQASVCLGDCKASGVARSGKAEKKAVKAMMKKKGKKGAKKKAAKKPKKKLA